MDEMRDLEKRLNEQIDSIAAIEDLGINQISTRNYGFDALLLEADELVKRILSSANRSKSDKGPANYLPKENVEDYCYAWLYLCSYYHLAMTQEEIDICVNEINAAFERGETVEFLGMY